jgi:hypothetical protein
LKSNGTLKQQLDSVHHVSSIRRRRDKNYVRGLERIRGCFSLFDVRLRVKLLPVVDLYVTRRSASALLRMAAIFEGEIVGAIWQAVQQHFALTKKGAIHALLGLPNSRRKAECYLNWVGQPNVAEILREESKLLFDAFKHAKEMRNRYIHGLSVYNAEQFAEAIVAYALALNAVACHFQRHPVSLLGRKFGAKRFGPKSNTAPMDFFPDKKPEPLWFTIRNLIGINNQILAQLATKRSDDGDKARKC